MMKTAFIFPGQGAQYPGMGADFVKSYPAARKTFEEADDLLERKLSDVILNSPVDLLTETRNSQVAIYVTSIAILRVINELFPGISPSIAAGLSLGEYTAATAASYFPFEKGLPLVQYRGKYMNDACEERKGAMAVVLGLDGETVEQAIKEVNLPNDLWAANFNCPGQVVISGTVKGIEAGTKAAKEHGAKRVLPLQVHGAFHSGLMLSAKKRLEPHIAALSLNSPSCGLVMNVTGSIAIQDDLVRQNLVEQVVSPVRWEQGVRCMEKEGVQLYLEIGPGKTLSGFNKRIGVSGKTVSIENVGDLKTLEEALS